ncbi:rod shape-determining protein MreD [Sphingomicrobium arenosum]|uniref:rod shape-determining protein MreD n=1 Tax=Sphingomicrobium arenosum TaxID=2233861 RepID=UPI00223F8BDE|nr:rod shape-determining protein MreD [Sphingomicrobium arenosum]
MARRAKPRPRPAGFDQGPRPFAEWVPAASIAIASLLVAMLPIVSLKGWWPDAGFLVLLAWRMHRSDPFPNWWAIPLGLINDLLSMHPIGLSVVTFCLALLAIDVVDARKMGRNWLTEWLLAALLVLAAEFIQWWVAAIQGAAMPLAALWPPIVITILAFPLIAELVALLDRYRLRKTGV